MGPMRGRRVLVLGLLLGGGLGCMAGARTGIPETPWPREGIAIFTPLEEPPLEFKQPVSGVLAGLGVGLGRGVGLTLAIALSGVIYGGPYGVVGSAPVAAAFGVFYIPASIVKGAVSSESPQRVAGGEAGLLTAMAGLRINRRLGERLRSAFCERAGRDLPQVEEGAGAGKVEGVEWHLEARVLGLWNGSTMDLLSVDRPCELYVAAGLRLVRASDGRAMAGRVAVYRSPVARHTYFEWGAENGRLLREEIERACEALAGELVEEIYLSTSHLRGPP